MGIENKLEIPNLYETEDIPLEEKIIYECWIQPLVDFYWLLAEKDPDKRIAFGYANLNDDINAEWGYIDLNELESIGAFKLDNWKPKKYCELMKVIQGRKE